MAYDPAVNYLDPKTGFLIDKRSGAPAYLHGLPPKSTHGDPEWPKWIEPHESHLVRENDDAPPTGVKGWAHHHIGRDGSASVLVANEDEEKRATSEWQEPEAAEDEGIDPHIMREVEEEYDRVTVEKAAAEAQAALEERHTFVREEALRRTKDHRERMKRQREEVAKATEENRGNVDQALGSSSRDRRDALGSRDIPPAPDHPAGRAAVSPYGDGDVIDDGSNKVIRGGAAPQQEAEPARDPDLEPVGEQRRVPNQSTAQQMPKGGR